MSAAGLVIGAAMLTRSTTGWACVIGALLVAGWFALGRGGAPNRRWCLPVAAAGLIPLAAGVAVNMAKFGTPFGLPLADQVYTAVNAHRRYFLAANGGKAFSLHFLPSTLVAYFQPGGLRLTPVYPFITLPAGPARVVGRVVMDRTNRTASVTASMPLLFLLGCWGLVTAFRRRPIGRVALTRMILLSATAATVGVLVWGYLDDRYLGDLLPILVVASAVGMCDVWRRLDARRSQGRRFHAQRLVVGTVVLLTVFGIWANVGIASTPTASWSLSEVANYVSLQKSISALTGHPLNDNVVRGTVLPYWAPADQLFIVGDCSGLYISNGESYQAVPKQELQHYTWLPVERGPDVVHIFEMTFRGPHLGRDLRVPVPLATLGTGVVSTITVQSDGPDHVIFSLTDPHLPAVGKAVQVDLGHTYRVTMLVDPSLHIARITFGSRLVLDAVPSASGHVALIAPPAPTSSVFSLVDTTGRPPRMPLCRSLLAASERRPEHRARGGS